MNKEKLTKPNGGGVICNYPQKVEPSTPKKETGRKKLSIVLGRKGAF